MRRVTILLAVYFAATMWTVPAWADLADYYFYSCASGIESCDFPQTYYGDFGMNGLTPVNYNYVRPPGSPFAVATSNAEGYVMGYLTMSLSDTYVPAVVFGFHGVTYCADLGCGTDEFERVIGVTDDGQFLWAREGVTYLGFLWGGSEPLNVDILNWDAAGLPNQGPYGSSMVGGPYSGSFDGLGINDQHQILANVDGVEGILSPFAVPEPSAFALLATVIGILLIVRRMGTNGRTASHLTRHSGRV